MIFHSIAYTKIILGIRLKEPKAFDIISYYKLLLWWLLFFFFLFIIIIIIALIITNTLNVCASMRRACDYMCHVNVPCVWVSECVVGFGYDFYGFADSLQFVHG